MNSKSSWENKGNAGQERLSRESGNAMRIKRDFLFSLLYDEQWKGKLNESFLPLEAQQGEENISMPYQHFPTFLSPNPIK